MLTIFKAKSCADVILLGANGRQILQLIGKDADAVQGIVTVEQLPDAIAVLEHAASADRAAPPPVEDPAGGDDAANDRPESVRVQLFQRIQPVLILFRQALGAATPVTWGV